MGEGEDGGEEARQGIGSLGAKKQHAPGVRVEGEGEGEEKRERGKRGIQKIKERRGRRGGGRTSTFVLFVRKKPSSQQLHAR